ncbi:ERF family protein [Paenibacillus sp. 79R4]|uniref:ERF family protein n=1 Tax=Paenibacillus sp. 79R4 TaxID=2212847 RepID=UPI0015BC700B|nr:ERF family protein [Paenibacillus sp. 79R4]NWL87589.1 ERF family protein [Paenibacillus sp. 79R4]
MRTSESISNISAALSKFQSEVKQPKKDTNNPFFNSKYVPLEGVVSVITEPLAKHGLSYIQSTGTEDEQVTITTLLMHTSGEFIESDPLKLPGHQVKKNGEKDFNPQGIGSAITYGRRYSLTALLGIASEDDDDGNSGTRDPKQTDDKGPKQPPSSLKSKWKLLSDNSLDGFDDWVTKKTKDGWNYSQMEQALTKNLLDKKAKEEQENA